MLYVSIPKINGKIDNNNFTEIIYFNEVNNIIKYRCGTCHASKPTFEGIEDAPLVIIFDNNKDIIKNIEKIKSQSIDTNIMPPGNITGMTENERRIIKNWIIQGKKN